MRKEKMAKKKPVIDIAVATITSQLSSWWSRVMVMLLHTDRSGQVEIGRVRVVSSALPDVNKNKSIEMKRRNSLTDANRNEIVAGGFLDDGADYLFFMDDDTVPPVDAILRLLRLGYPLVSGLYFMPSEPYNPIAYMKKEGTGLYEAVYDYPKGGLFEVDAIGMGCALIHRSVYEKIKQKHTVMERYNGSLFPILKKQVKKPFIKKHIKRETPYVVNGVYCEQVTPQREDDIRSFPFYLLEHGRTEDFHFCELAANVGIKPYLDTTVVCEHYKTLPTSVKEHDKFIEEEEGIFL